MKKLILLLVACLSCGGNYHVSSDDINVNVKHSFNLNEIKLAFKASCKRDNPLYTNEQLDDCAEEKLSQFLEDLVNAL